MSDGADQRQHPRLPLILQVQFADREGYVADATENLSAGGAFVQTDRELAIGDRIPVRLSFPGLLQPLDLTGVVAWVRPQREGAPRGVGLKIPDDRPEDKARLSQFLGALKSPTPAAPAPKELTSPPSGGFRILLVEDNPHVMELYEYVLKKLSKTDRVVIDVVLARDGHEALKQLQGDRFDLVVTDLYMPVLDGFEFIQRIRQNESTKTLPVIAISAGGGEAGNLATKAGANVFLRKPVRFVDVLETVKTLLKL